MNKLKLKVITPQKILLEEEVDAVYSTAVDGEFGVLPGHVPYMTPLAIGISKFEKNGKSEYLSTIGGVFQVKDNEVLILTDCAEFGKNIDLPRAIAAKERAEARLNMEANIDVDRARIALLRALARIQAASKAK